MQSGARTRLIALVVLLAVATPLLIVAMSSSGDDGGSEKPSLRLERAPGANLELVVYVEDPSLNTAAALGGERSVTVECLDSRDQVVFSSIHPWPFTDTDNGTLDPHQHLTMGEVTADSVASCRLG